MRPGRGGRARSPAAPRFEPDLLAHQIRVIEAAIDPSARQSSLARSSGSGRIARDGAGASCQCLDRLERTNQHRVHLLDIGHDVELVVHAATKYT
jgi:hypothetical protein